MKRLNKTQLNNKGFSLIETLVVLAIMGVVAILVGGLMVTGSKMYAGETARADIQNDIQFVNTKIQKTLMEATSLVVMVDSGVQYVMTGELDGTNEWTAESNPNGTAKAIIVYENHVYITDRYYAPDVIKAVDTDSDLKGYEMTEYLEKGTFSVSLQNTIEGSGSDTKTEAPVVVKIAYQMNKNNKTSKTSYEVALRNSDVIKNISINGQSIKVEK